jgi:hypothetical protein
MSMTTDDLHTDIDRLEARIEELADRIERCRKYMLVSRAAIAVGGVLIVAMIVGVIRFDALPILASLTMILGGFVALGSNSSTLDEAAAALQSAEAQRAALIGRIDLRLVGGSHDVRRLNGHA